MNRRPAPSIVANPVLVGAATVLVMLVGVFLAYNANNGLPFVPTYEIEAIVPDAAELVPGNDVRVGGKRVGVVSAINARRAADGTVTSALHLKLEKTIEPLAADTKVAVRPRSPLGLKYVELTPGTARAKVLAGGALSVRNAQPLVDLDEALNTFDEQVRRGTRSVTGTLSSGLAGRGGDLNAALEGIQPLVTHLTPVMRALRSRSADLRGFIDGLESAASAVDPVAAVLPSLLGGIGTTFSAVDRAAPEVRQMLDLLPETERIGTTALAVARPVLGDAAEIATALRPGTALLTRGTRSLADIVETGTPVLRRGTTLGPDLERTLKAVGRVAADPTTSSAIVSLTSVLRRLEPTLRFVNPAQTTCNYIGLFTRNAASTISEGDSSGNVFRFIQILNSTEGLQSAELGATVHNTPYGTASEGECETGNETFAGGRVIGHPAGTQPAKTQMTSIPPGVSHTP
jgi:ABC-type transporter Mla subunit MlaD